MRRHAWLQLLLASSILMASLALGAPAAQAHGKCRWKWSDGYGGIYLGTTTPSNPQGSGRINESSSSFAFNYISCDEQHQSFDWTLIIQRSSDNRKWTNVGSTSGGCGQGFSCTTTHFSVACNVGVSRWWRVKVTGSVGVDASHTPQNTGGSRYILCT